MSSTVVGLLANDVFVTTGLDVSAVSPPMTHFSTSKQMLEDLTAYMKLVPCGGQDADLCWPL